VVFERFERFAMSSQLVPLTTAPNQSLIVSLSVNGESIDLDIDLHYNEVAGYWVMAISTAQLGLLLDSIPLVSGNAPVGNLLGQFEYLEIGGFTLVNASQVALDYPNNTDLGTDFLCIWYDNTVAIA
jgi:hypothetical protein